VGHDVIIGVGGALGSRGRFDRVSSALQEPHLDALAQEAIRLQIDLALRG
jgi:hypothetical protein